MVCKKVVRSTGQPFLFKHFMKSIILLSVLSLTICSCMSSRTAEGTHGQIDPSGNPSSGNTNERQASRQLTNEPVLQENTSTEVIKPGGGSGRSMNVLKETK
jgi:hypothetical protein